MRLSVYSALLFLLASAMVGCVATQTAVDSTFAQGNSPAAEPPTREQYLALVEGGVPEELRNSIEIRNYRFGSSDIGSLPEVSLELVNTRADQPLRLEIRTAFFRQNGTIIDATPWAEVILIPGQVFPYRAVAYSSFAQSEQVQLRLVTTNEESG